MLKQGMIHLIMKHKNKMITTSRKRKMLLGEWRAKTKSLKKYFKKFVAVKKIIFAFEI